MSEKVAVLLAAYQGARYLPEQLDSLLRQTDQEFVCVIHDDGSTDGTAERIEEYCGRYPEKFRRIEGPAAGGAKENFRYLLKQTEADVYLFCDQDDVWLEDKIETELKALRELDPDRPACVYTNLKVVDQDLRVMDDSYYHYTGLSPFLNGYRQTMITSPCTGCTMMLNRKLRDRLISFETDNLTMHDWEAAMLAAALGNLRYLDRPTVLYRQHGENTCGALKKESYVQILKRVLGGWKAYQERKRKNISRPRKLAKEMLSLEGLSDEQKAFLSAFSEIGSRGKISRVRFYLRNGLLRQGVNRLWQIWTL